LLLRRRLGEPISPDVTVLNRQEENTGAPTLSTRPQDLSTVPRRGIQRSATIARRYIGASEATRW